MRLRTVLATTLCALTAVGLGGESSAHVDDPKLRDEQPPYRGPAFRRARQGDMELGFPAVNVTLMSWLPLETFDPVLTKAMDCWGYVSPSGREYALIGLSHATGIVEVTNPGDAQIVEIIYGVDNGWRDIKIFEHYAYVVTENNESGIQVLDLSEIDDGTVTLVNTVFSGGRADSHNVAINTESGYLYRSGGGSLGVRIHDLNADPVDPPFVAEWSERYSHDLQAVTMHEGPYAGRELVFTCGGYNTGHVETGLDILYVTDKENITQVSRLLYPNGDYSHQGWLSHDRRYFYLNDEHDEDALGIVTTTHVIDVSDLEHPFEATTFSSGSTSIDHNLYTRGTLIFEANYRSGLRVFDATDPLDPQQIAHFDTYPDDDEAAYNGLWSNYPYLPSGTVIGSDKEKGLFVWRLDIDLGVIGDVNGDGLVGFDDLLILLSEWGDCPDPPADCPADLDEDGIIGFQDLLIMLSNWG
jgi:choice-of-anchor B domain-containing protein